MTSLNKINQLLQIMAKLRDPETGCPWDVEQNFASIAPYTLEEAYEVVDAVERGDTENLREELGDLLLQVVFYSQMADEAGLFNFEDVAQAISEKMIRRHPHVFGDDNAIKTAQEQVKNWDKIKAVEHGKQQSVMDNVPAGFPALLRAQKLGKAASKKGFDWDELPPVFDKVFEEIGELKQSVKEESNIEEEVGDLLFAVVNVARHLKIDAETALRKANRKFEARFRAIEPDLTDHQSLKQKEALWQKAKTSKMY